eukprot:SAG11_NODE_1112_length_5821_cov_43.477281_2_plen_117_part_00
MSCACRANQKPQQELEDVVDKEMLSAAIEEITGLLKSHMLRCASKEELEELEAAMRAIQGGGDVYVFRHLSMLPGPRNSLYFNLSRHQNNTIAHSQGRYDGCTEGKSVPDGIPHLN